MAVFVVDDSAIGREVVKKALELNGYSDVVEAEDGVDALEKIKKNTKKVELYILDINMPKMDGLTLLGEIRKTDTSTPIVMLTTETDKGKMVKAKTLGATGWVIKPFDGEKFIKVVDMLLKG